jgi:hypothetical protein
MTADLGPVHVPAVHRDAFALLRDRGIAVLGDAEGIVRVDPDSILYRTEKQVMTAWLECEGMVTLVATEPGMPIERTYAAVPRGISKSIALGKGQE